MSVFAHSGILFSGIVLLRWMLIVQLVQLPYDITTCKQRNAVMPTITTKDTITIALSVKDRATSASWFKQHLGFEQIFAADEAGWTELATNTPGVTIGLGDAEDITGGGTMPVFGVDDFDKSRSALEKAGVRFDGDTIEVESMVKVAAFFDPDGNGLMIAEDLSV